VTCEIAPEEIDVVARQNEGLVANFGNIFELDLYCVLEHFTHTLEELQSKKKRHDPQK
jgi:hypothetical protein